MNEPLPGEKEFCDWVDAMSSGYDAGKRGDDPRSCPFDKMTSEWETWQRWHGFGVLDATRARS